MAGSPSPNGTRQDGGQFLWIIAKRLFCCIGVPPRRMHKRLKASSVPLLVSQVGSSIVLVVDGDCLKENCLKETECALSFEARAFHMLGRKCSVTAGGFGFLILLPHTTPVERLEQRYNLI